MPRILCHIIRSSSLSASSRNLISSPELYACPIIWLSACRQLCGWLLSPLWLVVIKLARPFRRRQFRSFCSLFIVTSWNGTMLFVCLEIGNRNLVWLHIVRTLHYASDMKMMPLSSTSVMDHGWVGELYNNELLERLSNVAVLFKICHANHRVGRPWLLPLPLSLLPRLFQQALGRYSPITRRPGPARVDKIKKIPCLEWLIIPSTLKLKASCSSSSSDSPVHETY